MSRDDEVQETLVVNGANGVHEVNGTNGVHEEKEVNGVRDGNEANGFLSQHETNEKRRRKKVVVVGLGMVGIAFMYVPQVESCYKMRADYSNIVKN